MLSRKLKAAALLGGTVAGTVAGTVGLGYAMAGKCPRTQKWNRITKKCERKPKIYRSRNMLAAALLAPTSMIGAALRRKCPRPQRYNDKTGECE